MQQAAEAIDSGMVSIMGLEPEQVDRLCAEAADGQVLAPANYNSPGQIVISGHTEACQRAAELAESDKFGGRAVPLKVAGAFHTDLMQPAADGLAQAVADAPFRQPKAQVIANVTARPYETVEQIREGLIRQLTNPIQWQQSMEWLAGQEDTDIYEVGPGRVLRGLMRQVDRKTKVTNINTVDTIPS
jgi:[acyl-carrier-protein] S-malonyltransferase